MADNSWQRVVRSILHLTGFALIILGLALLAEDFFLRLSHRPVSSTARLILKGLPCLAGLILLLTSGRLAERIARDLD